MSEHFSHCSYYMLNHQISICNIYYHLSMSSDYKQNIGTKRHCQGCIVDRTCDFFLICCFFLMQINFAQSAEALHNFIRGNDKVSTSNIH